MFIQNQGKSPGRCNKWDRQGRIVAIKDHDQHLVKVDGSGRLTLRNRRFLRRFQLRSEVMPDGGADQWGAPDSVSSTLPSAPKDDSISAAPGAAPSIAPGATLRGAQSGAPSTVLNGVPDAPPSTDQGAVPSTVPGAAANAAPSAIPSAVLGDAASAVPRISTGVAQGVAPSSAPNGATSTAPRVLPGAASCRAPCYPLRGENDASPTGCSVRRSSRQQMQRSVCDAATGTYVAPASR